MTDDRRRTYALVCAVCLALGALIVGPLRIAVSDTPTWEDEVFYAEPARELAFHGALRAPIFGDVRGLSEVFALQPPVSFFERALVFKLFGFGKLQVRIAGVAEYAACVALLFLAVLRAARGLACPAFCAGAAALLFATDSAVLRAATSGRPDMLAIALMLCSLVSAVEAAAANGKTRKALGAWAFALGSFSALSASSHPVMFALSPGAGLVCLLCVSAPNRTRAVSWFSLGWLAGMLPWLAHVCAHPDAWKTQFVDHLRAAYAGGSKRLHDQEPPIFNLVRHFGEIGDTYYVMLAMAVGLTLAAFYARGPQRAIALFALSSLVGLVPGQSFVKLMVAFVYAGGTIGWAWWAAQGNSTRRRTFAVLTMVLLFEPVVLHAQLVAQWRDVGSRSSERPIAELIARHIPEHAVVVSPPIAYFALRARDIEQLYPSCLLALRYVRTRADRAAHNAYLLRRRPSFMLLEANMPPGSVAKLERSATFTLLGSVKSQPTTPLLDRDRYDLRLYRVAYKSDPKAF